MSSSPVRPGARPRPPFRADHVGSFLRPKALLDAREQLRSGAIDAAALRAAEDAAIRDVVRYQEGLGLMGITDGEFRRTYFHTDFLTRLSGVTTKGGINVSFHSAAGNVDFAPPVMSVTDRVRHAQPIQRADFEFLQSVDHADGQGDDPVAHHAAFPRRPRRDQQATPIRTSSSSTRTWPAPTRRRSPTSRRRAAPTCSSTTPTSRTCATRRCARAHARAATIRTSCRAATRASSTPRSRSARRDMTACVHLCRGNFKSAWAAEGGYEPVAEVLFNELAVDGYFLEYDDARSGDFAPLRHVPKGKTVVLGLVSTKVGQLESKDDIKRRIDVAAQLVPLEQLCLSPQCGFSSTVHGNDIAVESQTAKLRLVVETAQEVWGGI